MAIHCLHCKAPITVANAKNCIHCGTLLPANPAASLGGTDSGEEVGFLRENWVWIVAPVVVAAIVLLVVVFVFGDGGDSSPFIYNIF